MSATVAAGDSGAPGPVLGAAAPARARRWTSGALFLLLFGVYSANGREIGAVDTIGNLMLPVAILRGDGLELSRFVQPSTLRRQYLQYAKLRVERVIPRHPVLPALLALPLTAPQLWLLDRESPGWETDRRRVHWWLRQMGKNSAAVWTAVTGVLLYRLLLLLGLGSVAFGATLATALGSELWTVASQSAWQHGPAALFLTVALLALTREPERPCRLAAGGLAMSAAVAARPTMMCFAAALAIWALVAHRRRGLWFLAPLATAALALMGYNLANFGRLLGGQFEIFRMRGGLEGVVRLFAPNPLEGLVGTLVSPSRGLLVFTPWVLLALFCLRWTAARATRFPALRAALWGLVPFYALVGSWAGWWAGWSFGPRYWTEAMPLFGVLLAFALAWARERSPAARAGILATIVMAVAVQATGAFCYPSSWHASGPNVDRDQSRLWDWRDTELERCLIERLPEPWDYPIFPDERTRQ